MIDPPLPPDFPSLPGRELLREAKGEVIPARPTPAPTPNNPAAHRREVITTLLWSPVLLLILFFAGREVFRLMLNLWHYSPLWVLIPVGIIVAPFLLYVLAFVIGFVFVLFTGKK